MEKQIIEKGENIVKFKDGSAEVKCSVCKEWEEIKAGSKQANLIENWPEKVKSWQCNKCYQQIGKDLEEIDKSKGWVDRTNEIRVGQALNLAVMDITRNGQEITPERVRVRVKFYHNLIKEIQGEYNNGKS